MPEELDPVSPFGRLLAAAMSEAGVKQPQLAKLTGIRQNQISRWKKGERQPDLKERIALARALGKPEDYFLPPELEDDIEAAAEAIRARKAVGGTNPFVTAEQEANARLLDRVVDQQSHLLFGRPFENLSQTERDQLWQQLKRAEDARRAPG